MNGLILIAYELGVSLLPGLFWLLFLWHRHHTGRHRLPLPRRSYSLLLLFVLYVIAVFRFTGMGTRYDGLRYQWEVRPETVNLLPFSNKIDCVAYILNITAWGKRHHNSPLFVSNSPNPAYIAQKCLSLSRLRGTAYTLLTHFQKTRKDTR